MTNTIHCPNCLECLHHPKCSGLDLDQLRPALDYEMLVRAREHVALAGIIERDLAALVEHTRAGGGSLLAGTHTRMVNRLQVLRARLDTAKEQLGDVLNRVGVGRDG